MGTPAVAERLLTVAQMAERAGVHPETIRRAMRTGELPSRRNRLAPGGPLMSTEADFKAFVAKRTA